MVKLDVLKFRTLYHELWGAKIASIFLSNYSYEKSILLISYDMLSQRVLRVQG